MEGVVGVGVDSIVAPGYGEPGYSELQGCDWLIELPSGHSIGQSPIVNSFFAFTIAKGNCIRATLATE